MKEFADKIHVRRPATTNQESNYLEAPLGPLMAPPESLFAYDEGDGPLAMEGNPHLIDPTNAAPEQQELDMASHDHELADGGFVSRMPVAEGVNGVGFEREGEMEGDSTEMEPLVDVEFVSEDGGGDGTGDGKKGKKDASEEDQKQKKGADSQEKPHKDTYQAPPPPEMYTIQKGDTFWALENQFGLAHGVLQKLNPTMKAKKLKIGDQMRIGGRSLEDSQGEGMERESSGGKDKNIFNQHQPINPEVVHGTPEMYTIRKGDTFWDLENRFGLEHGVLQALNPECVARKLRIGSMIRIGGTMTQLNEGAPSKRFGSPIIAPSKQDGNEEIPLGKMGPKEKEIGPIELSEVQIVAQKPTKMNTETRASIADQRNAHMLINEFEAENEPKSYWTNIGKTDFVTDLRKMILNPNSIDQYDTNLCGIAVVCKAMIEFDPESFVSMAISLFKEGFAPSNSWISFTIRANETMRHKTPQCGLNNSTYVIMPAIRGSYNSPFVPYDPETDNGFAGITYPIDIGHLLENFSNISNVTHRYSVDINGLRKAIEEGAFIIALFDINHLKSGNPNDDLLMRFFGNHFVQITDISTSGQDFMNVKYWNYGESLGRSINLRIETFDKALKTISIFDRNVNTK